MNIFQAVVLGVVEGITEFLPVSSTGHITITEKLLGLKIDDAAVTGFTAVIQVGAIAAVIFFFWKDLVWMVKGFFAGLGSAERRQGHDFKFALAMGFGSMPIAIIGVLLQDVIKGPLRGLWVIAGALVIWSGAMAYSEWVARQERSEQEITIMDGIVVGLAQSLALIPGVSRSGATITVGLLRGLDRVAATRMSFFLGIPALIGAGVYEFKDAISGDSVGIPALAVGTIVSFVVAYASIAWLMKFVAHHSLTWFSAYRVILGGILIIALASNALSST